MVTLLKPGLHIVVTIPEHVCDYVQKEFLKLSKYRLQIFLVKDHCLESLQLYGDKAVPGQLEKRVRKHVLAILATDMETSLEYCRASIRFIRTELVFLFQNRG